MSTEPPEKDILSQTHAAYTKGNEKLRVARLAHDASAEKYHRTLWVYRRALEHHADTFAAYRIAHAKNGEP